MFMKAPEVTQQTLK